MVGNDSLQHDQYNQGLKMKHKVLHFFRTNKGKKTCQKSERIQCTLKIAITRLVLCAIVIRFSPQMQYNICENIRGEEKKCADGHISKVDLN